MAQTAAKEAMYWERDESGRIHCLLCPHGCRLGEREIGRCRVRQNLDGALRTLNYGRVSALNWDPVEKKPIFHFHPGRLILSLGTVGCNLACAFCQNWSISQGTAGTRRMEPEDAVRLAESEPDNLGIAYTYNEPFVWYEFVLETSRRIKDEGLCNILVTNGYIQEEPLRELLPLIDAMNVDIKAMDKAFYRELCRGRPEPPQRTVEIAYEAGCLVEVTNLVIPNWNDDDEDIKALVDWLSGVYRGIPLHFSRYHPDHKLTEPPTPVETLLRAREIASEKLDYVYVGNVWGQGEDTICPSCKKIVVARRGFSVSEVRVTDGRCEYCGGEVAVVG